MAWRGGLLPRALERVAKEQLNRERRVRRGRGDGGPRVTSHQFPERPMQGASRQWAHED